MPIQNIIEVTDHELTALKWYRTLSREGEHYRDGIFVAEGEKVVPRLLESSNRIVSILLSKEWFQKLEKQIGARPERIDIYLIDKPGMEVLTGRSCYQPLKAVAQIPPNLTIDELISKRKSPSIYVAIEGVSNADNVGALVRNCAALGADGILVSSCASSPPSGPTSRVTDLWSSVSFKGEVFRALGSPTKRKEFSSAGRNSSRVTGPSMRGITARPDCLAASLAIF